MRLFNRHDLIYYPPKTGVISKNKALTRYKFVYLIRDEDTQEIQAEPVCQEQLLNRIDGTSDRYYQGGVTYKEEDIRFSHSRECGPGFYAVPKKALPAVLKYLLSMAWMYRITGLMKVKVWGVYIRHNKVKERYEFLKVLNIADISCRGFREVKL